MKMSDKCALDELGVKICDALLLVVCTLAAEKECETNSSSTRPSCLRDVTFLYRHAPVADVAHAGLFPCLGGKLREHTTKPPLRFIWTHNERQRCKLTESSTTGTTAPLLGWDLGNISGPVVHFDRTL